MKPAKRSLCLILCIILSIALLAGCGGGKTESSPTPTSGSESPSPTKGISETPPPTEEVEYYEHLNIAIGDKVTVIDLFNPAFGSSQVGIISHAVFDSLVDMTLDNEIVPGLATKWDTDDYKTFTFTLRENVKFHNGEPFTAEDVKYTIERTKATPGSIMASKYARIESVEVVNDYEVKITLDSPNVDFIADMSVPYAGFANKKTCEADPENGSMIGTGPWKVTEIVSNDYVSVARNDDYWGEVPVTKTMTFKFVSEETARYIMFENGDFDFCGIGSVFVEQYENDERFSVESYVMNNTNLIAFNFKDPLMADINFRMAVAHAMNREDFVNITLNGYGVPAEYFWGYRTEFRNTNVPTYEYNIDKAKEYLEKSKYNGETIEIVAAMAHPISNAQVLQENLSKIGVKTEIFATDGPTLTSYTPWGNTDSQIVVTSGPWTTLASSVSMFLMPGSIGNKANYDKPEMTELLKKAAMTFDAAEREKVYAEIQEIVATEIPYLPIFNMELFVAGWKGCGGVKLYATNNHDYAYAYRIKQ
ncbi:MAG TPA: ABC transporter substrate-binding protein [Papillibacter sp.]|nr:ABC transporter substrate-binding protein [Papillibacter sp.]